jgi:hypothetical protein
MTFVQNWLRASFRIYLPLCVRMELQKEYHLETFSHSALKDASESIFLAMH